MNLYEFFLQEVRQNKTLEAAGHLSEIIVKQEEALET